jgi:hypothetical protein
MKKLDVIFFGVLLILLFLSCSSKKSKIDRTTPEKTVMTLIDAINYKNQEIIDSIIIRKTNLDFLKLKNENSNAKLITESLEILDSTQSNVSIRLKISRIIEDKIDRIFDELISLNKSNQQWHIINIENFVFGNSTELTKMEALKLLYGTPPQGNADRNTLRYDTIYREPIENFSTGLTYFLLSTSQKVERGDEDGVGTDVNVNAGRLKWNGVKWVPSLKVENIMSSYDSNHGGIRIEIVYRKSDNTPFFLIDDYQEGELELTNNYTFLDQNLKVFEKYSHVRKWNPPFAGGDGSIENKPIMLGEYSKFYTYKFGFQDVSMDNKELRRRIRFDENDKPIYVEYWYKDRDEIMSEGGAVVDPRDSTRWLKDGYWYNKSNGFKGNYENGRLVREVDMSGFYTKQLNIELCHWCKLGVIVNGYCDQCGVPSTSTRNKLNEDIRLENINTPALTCINKANHHTYRYPNECPYCGYMGAVH